MKRFIIFCLLIATSLTGLGEDEREHVVKLKEIYRKVLPSGHVRFEYVFLADNNSEHRFSLLIDVLLLDRNKEVVERRFLSFDQAAGLIVTESIESDYGPPSVDTSPKAVFSYRLEIRNASFQQYYEKEGDTQVPVLQRKG